MEGNERKDMIQCTIPSPHRHGRKEIEEEIRGRREGAHTRQHTDTKGKKKGARERLCSWLVVVVVARFTNVIRMELHPLTTRKTQQQEEGRVFIFLSFLIITIYFTHSLTHEKKKKKVVSFVLFFFFFLIHLYGGEIEIDR